MIGGLCNQDMNLIVDIIHTYPQVVEARLFGSRAKGNYKSGSDIDVVLFLETEQSNSRTKVVNELHDHLEEALPLPYFFDIVDYDSINNDALKEHVDRVGVVIYKKDDGSRA